MDSITAKPPKSKYQFNRAGWPINPVTGKAFSRDEIVTDPSIPYPQDVDTDSAYWQRRSPAQLAEEKKRTAKKAQRRSRRRASRSKSRNLATTVPTDFSLQVKQQESAIVKLVKRFNGDKERTPNTPKASGQKTETILVNHDQLIMEVVR